MTNLTPAGRLFIRGSHGPPLWNEFCAGVRRETEEQDALWHGEFGRDRFDKSAWRHRRSSDRISNVTRAALGARRRFSVQSRMEEIMSRKFIDCRAFPSEMNCTIALSADSAAEMLEA